MSRRRLAQIFSPAVSSSTERAPLNLPQALKVQHSTVYNSEAKSVTLHNIYSFSIIHKAQIQCSMLNSYPDVYYKLSFHV